MDERLYHHAKAGHLVLTVNDRLSRALSAGYDKNQKASGLDAWLRPEIMSLSAWLSRTHARIPTLPLFLNKTQLLHTWEMVIQEDVRDSDHQLLQLTQTARRAMQAHQLLVRYAAEFNQEGAAEDHKAFLRWRARWLVKAKENDWYDSIELPGMLARLLKSGKWAPPKKILLAGFEDFSPDIKTLFDAMDSAGAEIEEWQPQPHEKNSSVRISANDMSAEVSLCARWIRRLLSHDPDLQIGIIVPQLETYRSLIGSIFQAELVPEDLVGAGEAQRLFNMSLGGPLAGEDIIHAALKLLKISGRLSQADVSWLFTSPYVGLSSSEGNDRALADSELRKKRCSEWSLKRLIRTTQTVSAGKSLKVHSLKAALKATEAGLERSRRKAVPGEWAEFFVNLLQGIGWPGERSLSSREYQAVMHFKDALGEFASLDGVSGKMSRSEAVRVFSRIVTNLEFQVEGVDETPVQVLGELESAGLSFDYLWIMGMHEEALPRPPSPNPFIPIPVQRRFQMQRADVEREFLYAQKLAARLLSSSPQAITSWPIMENGATLRPSTFIKHLPETSSLPLAETHSPASVIWRSRPVLQERVDKQAQPLSTRKPFSGGTGIIKDQALCPFRAFAHYRLNAEALETPEIGIDSLTRGGVAHKALELFWTRITDQTVLLELDDESLGHHVQQAVTDALDERYDIPARQRQIEHNRLQKVVLQWLHLERQRNDFKVVEFEQTHQVKVGDLTIRTRIDRVDRLDDGRLAIIDYKTGRTDPSQWLKERITDPQLPLYSLNLQDNDVGAVMFAEVRPKEDECAFRGVARSVDSWPRARSRKLESVLSEKGWSSFEDILSHWRESLPALGDEFAAGVASVSPVDADLACRYCDLKALCRILESEENGVGGDDV